MKSSIGIALSVSKRPLPREPSSSETRAMTLSSGASTIDTKSKRPSTAHCDLTVAPSCSTSLLTSRIRAGLFFTVWTPSGVSVESMMYVGMRTFYLIRVFRGADPREWISMRRLLIALPLVLALAPAAQAAEIHTELPCYYAAGTRQVKVDGTG